MPCFLLRKQMGAAGWDPCPASRKQNTNSSLITRLETASHSSLHGGLVLIFSLRGFPHKVKTELWVQKVLGGRNWPFILCPAVLMGSCCKMLQVWSYARQGDHEGNP